MSRATLMLIPLVLLSACGGGGASNTSSVPTTPTAPPGLVATSCGSYQGSLQGSTYAFLGIRYAAAPTGSRRWQAPQPATCPTTVQQSNTFGVKCPQLDTTTNAFVGDEDCLTLNVWAPTAAVGNNSARRPVFVFIHGGGNSLGSSSETLAGGVPTYRGDRLSGYANAVVVTVNYRIGPLGFLAHPSLDAETAQNTSGNYGILDLIAALRWVRDSIGNFGGDPARVMVFGQSAGGQNTCMLLASPLAAGAPMVRPATNSGCTAFTTSPENISPRPTAASTSSFSAWPWPARASLICIGGNSITGIWKRASVKSAAQCSACHTQAEQGRFDEQHLRIPR